MLTALVARQRTANGIYKIVKCLAALKRVQKKTAGGENIRVNCCKRNEIETRMNTLTLTTGTAEMKRINYTILLH